MYYLVFSPWLKIPLEIITYWPVVHYALWSVRKFFEVEYSITGQILKINYTGFGGDNIA